MITLAEAVKIAKKEMGNEISKTATEYEDRFVFAPPRYIIEPGTSVSKKDGKTSVFFPPKFSPEYLDSGKEINIVEYLKD